MKRRIEKPTPNDPPAPQGFFRRAGGRLTLALAGYGLIAGGVPLALGAAFRALFQMWNLNPDTVSRAPAWARALYTWHGSLITLMASLLTLCLCAALRRERPARPRLHSLLVSQLGGMSVALGLAALFLMADSLRPDWPLSRPHITGALVALWLLTGIGVAAEEWYNRHVIYEIIRERWGVLPAVTGSVIVYFLFTGGLAGNVVSGVNVALMGLACVLMYRRCGLWVPVGFRWGWSFSSLFLLGQGGGGHAVYRLYGVSEGLLTGGDAGFVYGLGLTAALAGLVLWLVFGRQKKPDESGTSAR